MSAITASRPSSKFVAPEIFSSSVPDLSIAAALRFVPPRSIPIAYSAISARHHITQSVSAPLAVGARGCQIVAHKLFLISHWSFPCYNLKQTASLFDV